MLQFYEHFAPESSMFLPLFKPEQRFGPFARQVEEVFVDMAPLKVAFFGVGGLRGASEVFAEQGVIGGIKAEEVCAKEVVGGDRLIV